MNNPLIVSDPAVMMGKPVIAGTRLTVEFVLEELAAGTPVDQLLAAHPRLTRDAVSAALAFAARALKVDSEKFFVNKPATDETRISPDLFSV
ncbi:MAG: DUF433 domain-containing protein [Fimbriiglobus sp.]